MDRHWEHKVIRGVENDDPYSKERSISLEKLFVGLDRSNWELVSAQQVPGKGWTLFFKRPAAPVDWKAAREQYCKDCTQQPKTGCECTVEEAPFMWCER